MALAGIGLLTGMTTVMFGFGGGFVAVPVVVWADAVLGGDAMRVATATSALVMVVNAGFATLVTSRQVLRALRGSGALLLLRRRLTRRHDSEPEALRWHLDRCGELDAILDRSTVDDFTVDTTTGSVTDIAASVIKQAGWL